MSFDPAEGPQSTFSIRRLLTEPTVKPTISFGVFQVQVNGNANTLTFRVLSSQGSASYASISLEMKSGVPMLSIVDAETKEVRRLEEFQDGKLLWKKES